MAEATTKWKNTKWRGIRINNYDIGSQIYAFFSMEGSFVSLVQNFGHELDLEYRRSTLARKPYDDDRRTDLWQIEYLAQSARSPFLADGTIVLYFADLLRLVDIDGREVGRIAVRFVPGMVSVDTHDTIWGIGRGEKGLFLQSFTPEGEKKVDVTLGDGTPMQPPIPLPDGRVMVVTKKKLFCVKHGKLDWERKIPELEEPKWLHNLLRHDEENISFRGGHDPLATGTANSKLLLKHGYYIQIFEDRPVPTKTITAPDQAWITSNALVTHDGYVCFACRYDIYCVKPR